MAWNVNRLAVALGQVKVLGLIPWPSRVIAHLECHLPLRIVQISFRG
jgi:hypothetical protein